MKQRGRLVGRFAQYAIVIPKNDNTRYVAGAAESGHDVEICIPVHIAYSKIRDCGWIVIELNVAQYRERTIAICPIYIGNGQTSRGRARANNHRIVSTGSRSQGEDMRVRCPERLMVRKVARPVSFIDLVTAAGEDHGVVIRVLSWIHGSHLECARVGNLEVHLER